MTPLYDILSAWPYIGEGRNQLSWHDAGMAMALRSKNAHYHFKEIYPRHWHALALKNGGPDVWNAMIELAASVDNVLTNIEMQLPRYFPAQTWGTISTGMRDAATRFLSHHA